MTAQKPLLLFQNYFNDHVDSIAAPEANACDWRIDTKWAGTTADTLTTPTFSSVQKISAWAISGHNLGGLGYIILLDYSLDSGTTWLVADSVTPTTNRTILRTFTEIGGVNRLRIRVQGGAGTWSIGVIAAGQHLVMERWADRGFDPSPRAYDALVGRAKGGSWIGSGVKQTALKETWNFAHLTAAWIEANTADQDWLDFERHALFPGGKPFFFAWDYGDHSAEVKYCWFPKGSKISKKRGANLRVPLLSLSFLSLQEDDS